jgi:hypothetical protein
VDEVKAGAQDAQKGQIRLDQAAARVTYSNFVLVATGTEEFVVTFGVNTGEDGTIRVSDKIILSPKNAKRLAGALSQGVRMYEEKLGAIDISTPSAGPSKK